MRLQILSLLAPNFELPLHREQDSPLQIVEFDRAGFQHLRGRIGFVTDLDGSEDMLTKGHIIAGNETMHRELLRVLQTEA